MSETADNFDPSKFTRLTGGTIETAALRASSLPIWASLLNRLPLPEKAREYLHKFGVDTLPQVKMQLRNQELIVSPDNTILGIETDNHGILGASVFMGEGTEDNKSHRVMLRQEEGLPVPAYIVNEGRFNINLFAPPPRYIPELGAVEYHLATVTVMNEVSAFGDFVHGTSTGYSGGRGQLGLVNWLILNEWAEPGVPLMATRAIEGIHLPEHEDETMVLKMHALREERKEAMEEAGALNGSGLVAVQFYKTYHTVNNYLQKIKLPNLDLNTLLAQLQLSQSSPSYGGSVDFGQNLFMGGGGMKGGDVMRGGGGTGLTGFQTSTKNTLAAFKSTGSEAVGSPILFSVIARDAAEVTVHPTSSVKLVAHRHEEGKQTMQEILSGWSTIPQHIWANA